MWICASPEDSDAVFHALETVVPDLPRRLETAQLRVVTYDQWYVDETGDSTMIASSGSGANA
jgi:hypothetical protein